MRRVPGTCLLAVMVLCLGALPLQARPARGKQAAAERVVKAAWGTAEGSPVDLYVLTNRHGLVAKVTTLGARLTEMHVPDRKGKLGDVVLGFATASEYERPGHFGAIVGRVANRIANATFELDGKRYELQANDHQSHIHGGVRGWSTVLWSATPKEVARGAAVELTYQSRDGEEGYPGNVTATVLYTLTDDDELRIEMTATTDRPTIVNMAHHSYWNLHGGSGDIRDHLLTIHADAYTPGRPPDGAVLPVAGTPFDFARPKPIGQDLEAAGSVFPGAPAGYDHNFVVRGEPDAMRPVARVEDPRSGRVMTIEANQPCVQFYSSMWMDGSTGGKGQQHVRYGGLCLETQQYPNAINVPAWRDGVILRPGQTYRHLMVHRFTTTGARKH